MAEAWSVEGVGGRRATVAGEVGGGEMGVWERAREVGAREKTRKQGATPTLCHGHTRGQTWSPGATDPRYPYTRGLCRRAWRAQGYGDGQGAHTGARKGALPTYAALCRHFESPLGR